MCRNIYVSTTTVQFKLHKSNFTDSWIPVLQCSSVGTCCFCRFSEFISPRKISVYEAQCQILVTMIKTIIQRPKQLMETLFL